MHLLLTDRLTCPRCGPTFGLILLTDQMVDRRVRRGTLGCPNCRDAFSVDGGFVDLRAPPRGPLGAGLAGIDPPDGDPDADDEDEHNAERLVALLGIPRGPGTVVTVGRPARFAGAIERAVEDLQVVAVDPDVRGWPDRGSVTRMVAAPGLPFFSGTLRGAIVDGRAGRATIFEGARVVAPMSRVIVTGASDLAEEVLEEAGLSILASESGTVVATRR
ncbi:MAG: hypothetical protein OEN56_06540 [Gemmatimonadota bacterium]|nr:hypothetical protein [Gemmatimonadota bacterium]MDH3424229.1 hypothetical protein [Gemmatimonadota bacterium]